MHKKNILAFLVFLLCNHQTFSQANFSFNCARDTVITNCAISCITLVSRIPDIRSSTASYVVNPINNTNCFNNYVSPAIPGSPTNLTTDDRYSPAPISLPFTFPFFGTNYNALLASTNGYVSFDVSLSGMFSHYGILNSGGFLSATTGTPQNLPSTLYDRALIMGPYHDINPATTTSPTRQIKYDVQGIAPHRKWILSFYKVPLFDCTALIENTHQIVLYEGVGVVEVFINSKQNCSTWNQGRAMVGMQDYNRTTGIMAPGRAASNSPWGGINMNESWRFVPASGPTLYRKVELFDLAGNLVSTGDTTSIGNSTFEVNFPNVCPSTTTTYIVKSTYEQFNNPGQFVVGNDTVRVIKSNSITNTTSVTNVSCNGTSTGSITLVASGGAGGPYEYSINGGSTYQPSGIFNNLAAGAYNIRIRDNGACIKDTIINIVQPAALLASATTANATCSATANGSITLVASGGTSPISYSIDGNAFQPSNVFTVTNGTYVVTIRDNNGCTVMLNNIIVGLTNDLVLQTRADTTICRGVPVTLTTTSNAASFTWTPTAGLSNSTIASPVATPSVSTSYTVTATLGQCSRQASVNINVVEQVSVNAGLDVFLISGDQAQLNASVVNATSYTWSPVAGLSSASILNPVASPASTTLYTLTVRNNLGCTASDDLLVTVIPYCIKVKNAFTPNGDGNNDLWQVYDQFNCLRNVSLTVFNRYGNKVYESRDYRNNWDGRYNGKSVPDGTYYAVIHFTLINGKIITIKSDLTILR